MNFFKQILAEAKLMLQSKFILISGIIIFALLCVVTPIISLFSSSIDDMIYGSSYYGYGGEELVIDGVTVPNNSELYWDLRNFVDQRDYATDWYESQDEVKYAVDLNQELIDFYLLAATQATDWADYRIRLTYQNQYNIIKNFVIQTDDINEDAMTKVLEYNGHSYVDISKELEEYTDEDKAELASNLEDVKTIIANNDFNLYVDYSIRNYNKDIEDYNQDILDLEADIIADPSKEEYLSEQIEHINMNISDIQEIQIPELEYRLANGIVPGDGSWENDALDQLNWARSDIKQATTYKLTEEEFYESEYELREYETYSNYEKNLQDTVIEAEKNIFVAQSSLDTSEPDMKFVQDGARTNVNSMLSSVSLVAIFGILIGGYTIAGEFQSGTVRLLMIRPRIREKVILSRFLAGLIILYVLYFAIFLTTIVITGFTHGFSDYSFPNYTASGDINFFLMLFERMMVTSVSMLFCYIIAFSVSMTSKNIAVSIIIPTLVLFGATIVLAFAYQMSTSLSFIAFTPIPYINMYDFYAEYSMTSELISKGFPLSIPLGIGVNLIYGAVIFIISLFSFKKLDITN